VTTATSGVSSEAAFYIGIEKGYFVEQGIDVQLVPFKVAADVVPAGSDRYRLTVRRLDAGRHRRP
jgi:ABC-type nitrate/sulfonate/bicarbonate transport system substrate-binding protein